MHYSIYILLALSLHSGAWDSIAVCIVPFCHAFHHPHVTLNSLVHNIQETVHAFNDEVTFTVWIFMRWFLNVWIFMRWFWMYEYSCLFAPGGWSRAYLQCEFHRRFLFVLFFTLFVLPFLFSLPFFVFDHFWVFFNTPYMLLMSARSLTLTHWLLAYIIISARYIRSFCTEWCAALCMLS